MQCFDAGQQFTESERLGQVVVTPGIEAVDAVADITERAEHEGRRGVARSAQRPNDGQPLQFGQHPIDHHYVVGFGGGEEQTLLARGGMVDRVATFFESLDDKCAYLRVIFNQQNTHRYRRAGVGFPSTYSPIRRYLATREHEHLVMIRQSVGNHESPIIIVN